MSSEQSRAASTLPMWITSVVSVFALLATVYFQYSAREDQLKHDLLEHRRIALFHALQVIDNVYSNEPLNGHQPNPHPWDISLARDADNEMRIYCQYPDTLQAFRKALGVYNPDIDKPHGVSLLGLDEFRSQVAKELNLPVPIGSDLNLIWISNLSGATSSGETKPK
jgi:hypothetical protein